MKIYIYIIIVIIIYFYIVKNNLYTLTNIQHIYFWGIISIILLLCYLFIKEKRFIYKVLKNINSVDKKGYYLI